MPVSPITLALAIGLFIAALVHSARSRQAVSAPRAVATVAATIWALWLAEMMAGSRWGLVADGWFMSVTMAFGSFIAGSTSEGGGAVAFPVMTLLFDVSPATARDFSLMIQAVGMNAAAVTILLTRVPVVRRALAPATVGGALGIVFGLEVVADVLPAAVAKLLFTSTWLAFGFALVLINRSRQRAVHDDMLSVTATWPSLLAASFVGGIISSITGSGLDICIFSLLVLRHRVSEAVATPTSVVLMGLNAAVGFAWKSGSGAAMSADAWQWWWACVPVVVVGAPLGAWFIRNRSRLFIARLLLASILLQYVGAMLIVPLTTKLIGLSVAVVAVGSCLFGVLGWLGREREPANRPSV